MTRLCALFLALSVLAVPLAAIDAPETPPLAEIHAAYLERDVSTHTRLLRGALREARRLLPEACAQRQRDLVNAARILRFDGLESLWLIYQDCAAQGTGPALRAKRLENALLLRETLRYAAPPAPQLALRVSHWNSVLERGVRGEAVRTVLAAFVAADPAKAQGWNLRNLLRLPQVSGALCAIPPRQNQFGKKALAELLRQGQCLTGMIGPSAICEELEARSGGAGSGTVTIPGATAEENKRLSDLCNNLAGGDSAVGAGMDLFDGLSSDECAGEDETYLYETEEIAQLTQDCFLGGDGGNPLALGPADVGIVRNRHIRWENAGTYNDFITIGEGKEGNHFHGVGDSAEEASQNLKYQLEAGGATVEEDGTITRENEWVDEDGTQVQERTTVRPDGTVETETNRTYPDGTTSAAREVQNPDGTSTRDTVIQNPDGSFSVEHSETDKDGNTKGSGKQYDADGNETGSWERTSPPQSSVDENGFDPNNPACQELASLTVIPGSNRSTFLDQMFQRGRPVDPRKVYPAPDSAGQEEEPICGFPAVGDSSSSPARCNVPVLCEEGTQLDDNCRCSQPVGGTLARQGCITANCPADTYPVPVGMDACYCASGEEPEGGPPPIPDVAGLAIRAFSELVWQRGDGAVFVTEDMARGGEGTGEPPR